MSFVSRARELQSRFLAESPTFSSRARNISGVGHQHLLPRGCEIETLYPSIRTAALEFFDQRSIKWWKSPRSGDDVSVPGPTRNLVSSQVACVNFLLPLVSSPESLTAMLRSIDDDIVDVALMEYNAPKAGVRCSSLVEMEWVGLGSTLEGAAATRGANVTSADALLVGVTADTRRRAYLFEWKNAEAYPLDECKGLGASGDKRRKRYASLYIAEDSPFSGVVPINGLLYEPFYQLMRVGLLGAKMVRDAAFGVSEARVVVACPAGNAEYRNRITSPDLRPRPEKTVESVMRGITRMPDAYRVVDQAVLAEGVRSIDNHTTRAWFEYNSARYGW